MSPLDQLQEQINRLESLKATLNPSVPITTPPPVQSVLPPLSYAPRGDEGIRKLIREELALMSESTSAPKLKDSPIINQQDFLAIILTFANAIEGALVKEDILWIKEPEVYGKLLPFMQSDVGKIAIQDFIKNFKENI